MKKTSRIALALIVLPLLLPISQAATSYIGSITQPVSGTFWQTTQPVSFGAGVGVVVSSVTTAGIYSQPPGVLANGTTGFTQLDQQGNTYSRVVGAPMARNVPVQTQVTATASTGQLLAANANRIGLECDSTCTNTQNVFINWGSVAATTSMKFLTPCSSWSPPAVSTVAIQVISASGSQVVTCIEYNNQ